MRISRKKQLVGVMTVVGLMLCYLALGHANTNRSLSNPALSTLLTFSPVVASPLPDPSPTILDPNKGIPPYQDQDDLDVAYTSDTSASKLQWVRYGHYSSDTSPTSLKETQRETCSRIVGSLNTVFKIHNGQACQHLDTSPPIPL